MIRTIVLAIFGIIAGFTLLWLLYPMIELGQNSVLPYIDQEDPAIESALNLGNMWYLALGMIGFLVAGFILYARAHNTFGDAE